MSSTIKSWAEEDRPREKMLLKGKASLTDAELIAILLGSGSRDESAVSLARRILSDLDNLDELGRKPLDYFMNYKGIGEAKAITIAAALELGRRRQLTEVGKKVKITSSDIAFRILGPQLADLHHEEFWIAVLSQANTLIAKECISQGGLNATVVDPKIIFSIALRHQAAAIILYHNHPSGQVNPSQADHGLTQKIIKAGEYLSIRVNDHIIVGHGKYYSFRDEGHMD